MKPSMEHSFDELGRSGDSNRKNFMFKPKVALGQLWGSNQAKQHLTHLNLSHMQSPSSSFDEDSQTLSASSSSSGFHALQGSKQFLFGHFTTKMKLGQLNDDYKSHASASTEDYNTYYSSPSVDPFQSQGPPTPDSCTSDTPSLLAVLEQQEQVALQDMAGTAEGDEADFPDPTGWNTWGLFDEFRGFNGERMILDMIMDVGGNSRNTFSSSFSRQ